VVHVACMGEMRNAYKILVGKPEGKRPPKHRSEDNIKMDLMDVAWVDVDQMHLAQGAVVNTVMNLWVP